MECGRPAWPVVVVAAWSCFFAAPPASGQALGPDARPFASCARVADASRLDALRRPGIAAVNCAITPDLRFAVLIDETVSWPMIKDGDQAWVSLEDPVAAKVWFPNTSPLQVRLDRDAFVAVRNADGTPLAIIYSTVASRTDAPGNINVLVAVRARPPCFLGVTREPEEALRLARDPNSPCISPVRR